MARKALLVGLNRYPDPANELRGCVNDVLLMRETLERHYGFADPARVRSLIDHRATTAAILEGLAWLEFSPDFAHLLAFPLGWLSSFLFTKGPA